MKPIYTLLTTLALLTFCLAGSAAAQRLLDEHEVVSTYDARLRRCLAAGDGGACCSRDVDVS